MPFDFSDNYLRFNSLQSKEPVYVVDIEGIPLLSSGAVYSQLRYGDPGITYGGSSGGSPLVYGGLGLVPGVLPLLSLDSSSLTLSQKLEPEQGKASISTLTLAFVDINQQMSKLIASGVVVDEILGKSVKVYIGYKQISYPEDYPVIFRGRITSVASKPGIITIQTSDPNMIRRQNIFFSATTNLVGALDAVSTTVPVLDNSKFTKHVLGPDATYDASVRTYIRIDDEFMEYAPAGFGTNTFTVTRGALGSVATTHDDAADVTAWGQLQGLAMDLALKIMLSGWGGNFLSGVVIQSIVGTGDPIVGNQAQAIILPIGVDAARDYGLTVGDTVTISGSSIPGNNTSGTIFRLAPLSEQENRIIYINASLSYEFPSAATLAFRSQYDTLPDNWGVGMLPAEVDVTQHTTIRDTFLLDAANSYLFDVTEQQNAKNFIELEIYLPVSCYSLTRQGQLSVNLTHPPIADDRLQFLDETNVLDPQNIIPTRGTNARKFYNEIQFSYDYDPVVLQNFAQVFDQIDLDSLNVIGVSSVLPIASKGAKTSLGTPALFPKRASLLLSRYKRGALMIPIKTKWEVGCQIEAGDVVALVDNGNLQITNFNTGIRNMGAQLFEVVDRTLDLKSGVVSLQLISGINSDITDRFATISPSSVIVSASSASVFTIEDSFGAIFPEDEPNKWRKYVGQKILVHNFDYSQSAETTLSALDPSNNYNFFVDPPLPFTPSSGFIVDVPEYPSTADTYTNQLYKSIHAFLDPTVTVTAGVSSTIFQVGSGDIAKFLVGAMVRVHSEDYAFDSGDLKVTFVDSVLFQVTVASAMPGTPSAGHQVDLIGFADKGGAYRWF